MPGQSLRARIRLAMVAGAILVVGWLFWSARDALTPFLFATVVAVALAPLVDRVLGWLPFRERRPQAARVVAVLTVYLGTILVLGGLLVMIAPRVGDQALTLSENAPALVATAREELEQWAGWYRERVPPVVQQQVDQASQDLARRAATFGTQVLQRIFTFITSGITGALAYLVVPFWLYYLLMDRDRGTRAFVGLFPVAVRDDVRILLERANRTFGAFIRAQLILSTVSGVVTGFGLALLGVQPALVLGVIAGIANLIPVLGPMIGGLPILLVTAATRPGWMILWVFLFLFAAQNLKDYLLVPHLQGDAVRLHPAIILPLLVIAGHLGGFWGLLLAVPLASIVRDIYVYIYRRLGASSAGLVVTGPPEAMPPDGPNAPTA